MLVIDDSDVCECGAYFDGRGFCAFGHPRVMEE